MKGKGGNMGKDKLVEFYSTIQSKAVEWLWYPYIPYGKITIIQGDPGDGKTTVALYLTSILSNGGEIPITKTLTPSQIVIYQNAEDGVADTIKPRLERFGANCERVCYLREGSERALERLENAIEQTGARMVILDPIQAFLGENDIQRANNVRPFLTKLANIAERMNCAIILVGHLNKRENGKDLYRGLGSIDFAAAARSILTVSKVEEGEENERMLSHIKSNLAKCGDTLVFTLDEEGISGWRNATEIELFDEQKAPKHKIVEKLLVNMLSEKDMKMTEIETILTDMGFSLRTVRRAKANLGISSIKVGTEWYWAYGKN